MVFPPYLLPKILQWWRRRIQRELVLVGVLRSIALSSIDHAIFNKIADALPQGQGIMVAWTIGPYAMKIKNVELLAITAVERISQRCGLPIRSGRRSLAPRSVRTVRKKATQKHRT